MSETSMSTLGQSRGGLSRTWQAVSAGWRAPVEHGGDVLPRIQPAHLRNEAKRA
jgi:hypothetical protein